MKIYIIYIVLLLGMRYNLINLNNHKMNLNIDDMKCCCAILIPVFFISPFLGFCFSLYMHLSGYLKRFSHCSGQYLAYWICMSQMWKPGTSSQSLSEPPCLAPTTSSHWWSYSTCSSLWWITPTSLSLWVLTTIIQKARNILYYTQVHRWLANKLQACSHRTN